jgi:hypothetical protein
VIEFVFMLTHNDVTVAAGSVATAAQIADLVGVSR